MMTNKQHIMTEGQLLTAVPFCIFTEDKLWI